MQKIFNLYCKALAAQGINDPIQDILPQVIPTDSAFQAAKGYAQKEMAVINAEVAKDHQKMVDGVVEEEGTVVDGKTGKPLLVIRGAIKLVNAEKSDSTQSVRISFDGTPTIALGDTAGMVKTSISFEDNQKKPGTSIMIIETDDARIKKIVSSYMVRQIGDAQKLALVGTNLSDHNANVFKKIAQKLIKGNFHLADIAKLTKDVGQSSQTTNPDPSPPTQGPGSQGVKTSPAPGG